MVQESTNGKYLITTAYMGFGHLRAAHNLGALGNGPILRVDRNPFLKARDRLVWTATQYVHTTASQDVEGRNKVLFRWFEGIMELPDDHTPPSVKGAEFIQTLSKLGVGKKLAGMLGNRSSAIVHTFYLPAMLSLYHGFTGKNFLLLCDSDFHRVWVPVDAAGSSLYYLVPTAHSADRLVSYGVNSKKIFVTGFPLPFSGRNDDGSQKLREAVDARSKRVGPASNVPITVMFPFSGAGAYSNVLSKIISSLADNLREGSIRLVVSCGNNIHAFAKTRKILSGSGIDRQESIRVIFNPDLFSSFDEFNSALEQTDVVVTKPGELVFYAALGLPMLLLRPIGGHEAGNREYLKKNNCAMDLASPEKLQDWLRESRTSGKLLELTQNGYNNLPRNGAAEIDQVVRSNTES